MAAQPNAFRRDLGKAAALRVIHGPSHYELEDAEHRAWRKEEDRRLARLAPAPLLNAVAEILIRACARNISGNYTHPDYGWSLRLCAAREMLAGGAPVAAYMVAARVRDDMREAGKTIDYRAGVELAPRLRRTLARVVGVLP